MANIRNESGRRDGKFDVGGMEAWSSARENYFGNMQELVRTAQGAATRCYEQGMDAMQQLAACRNMGDFTDTYFRVAREGIQTAMTESQRLAEQAQAMVTASLQAGQHSASAAAESAKSNVAQTMR
jgi:hypothetical protein